MCRMLVVNLKMHLATGECTLLDVLEEGVHLIVEMEMTPRASSTTQGPITITCMEAIDSCQFGIIHWRVLQIFENRQ